MNSEPAVLLSINPANNKGNNENVKLAIERVSWYARIQNLNADQSEEGYCGQDTSVLKYWHLPDNLNVHLNLNREHPDDDFKLDKYKDHKSLGELLMWLKEFSAQSRHADSAEFVGGFGQFAEFLALPLTKSTRRASQIKCLVAKVGGKIFIRRMKEESSQKPLSKFDTMRSKQGLLIRKYFLSDSPSQAPDPMEPLIHHARSSAAVLHATLGSHKLLYKNHILGLDDSEHLLNLKQPFTRVNTTSKPLSKIKWTKWLHFWSEAVLGKTDRLYFGYLPHPMNGIVTKLHCVPVHTIFQRLQNAFKYNEEEQERDFFPSEEVCFDFLDRLLSFLKDNLKNAQPDDVYELAYQSHQPEIVSLQMLNAPKDADAFVVPQWYQDWVISNN